MTPYALLVFAFYAWVSRSLNARCVPPPWPPRRRRWGSTPAEQRLRDLGDAGNIYRETFRVVLARPPRLVGTVFGLALPVSALYLAHTALLSRLVLAWGCGCWLALPILALLDAACLCALFILSGSAAGSFAISVASHYCCAADDDGARDALVERLIDEARCRRVVVNSLRALVIVLLFTAFAGAVMLVARALPGAPTLGLCSLRDSYLAGLLYFGAEYQLAAVVSFLEPDEHAMRCFSRSSALLAGNFCAAACVFTVLVHAFEVVHAVFGFLVLDNRMCLGFALRVATALATVAALCAVVAAALVAQPVIYFTCKTYHNEPILLGLGEHEPLDARHGVHKE